MRRVALLLSVLGLGAIWAGLAYQSEQGRERDYHELLHNGDAALASDQAFQAIEAYSNAIYLRPDSMLAHLRRGEAYQRRGDVDAAARDFESASAIDPSATRPLEALADLRYSQDRFNRAAEVYEKLLSLDDRSPRVARKLALSRFRDRDVDGAMDALDQAARFGTRDADDYYLLGLCLRERAQIAQAAAAFEHAVHLAPSLTPPREELVDLYGAMGRIVDQLGQLQVLAGLDAQNAERQVVLSLAYARSGRVDMAVETLRNALEGTSDQTRIYGAIGRVWLENSSGRTDLTAVRKAIEALERGASSTDASSELLTLYGHALLLDGQTESAERVLQQATERFPIDPAAFSEFATAAERRGHLQDARTALLRYGALVANDRALAIRAGRVGSLSLRLNEPATAVLWLRRAESVMPNDMAVITPLADALLRTGDRSGARAAALHGLKLEPTNVALRSVEIRTRDF